MIEKEVQKIVEDKLTLWRCIVFRQQSGAMKQIYKGKERFIRMGKQGTPDILACSPTGEFMGIEVKSKMSEVKSWLKKCQDITKEREYFQRDCLQQLNRKGAITLLAWFEETEGVCFGLLDFNGKEVGLIKTNNIF